MRERIISLPLSEFKELKAILCPEERFSDEWLDREGVRNLVMYLGAKRDRRIVFTVKDEA